MCDLNHYYIFNFAHSVDQMKDLWIAGCVLTVFYEFSAVSPREIQEPSYVSRFYIHSKWYLHKNKAFLKS